VSILLIGNDLLTGNKTMTLPKLLALLSLCLFGLIGVLAFLKEHAASPPSMQLIQIPLEIELDKEIQTVMPALAPYPAFSSSDKPSEEAATLELPNADRIEELFNKKDPKLPIVETITYKSRVPWQKGRPAWLSDYAAHYNTSRHFIARSLNGKPDYLKQEVAEGDCFNVLRQDKNFEFYLVVDTSRCRMWFYYLDRDAKEKVLLKTYSVGLGRLDSSKASGLLTPLGKYTLGDRIAIYKPKLMGMHHGNKIEMISVFGTRWIPFDKELGSCTEPAKGFGIHGTPWSQGAGEGLIEQNASIGKYESDGCIRLATPDMEELFAIVITKPTTIEIVHDFAEASLVPCRNEF
jgi:hypothetical protein